MTGGEQQRKRFTSLEVSASWFLADASCPGAARHGVFHFYVWDEPLFTALSVSLAAVPELEESERAG